MNDAMKLLLAMCEALDLDVEIAHSERIIKTRESVMFGVKAPDGCYWSSPPGQRHWDLIEKSREYKVTRR